MRLEPTANRFSMETARAGASPAPDITVTVAPFRAWRGSRLIVAEKPTRAAIDVLKRLFRTASTAGKVGAKYTREVNGGQRTADGEDSESVLCG
jgi:hypothetical protein